ncbi:MAG: hypothetical protein ABJA66_11030, partial [Actinomycetota bacterium]
VAIAAAVMAAAAADATNFLSISTMFKTKSLRQLPEAFIFRVNLYFNLKTFAALSKNTAQIVLIKP